MRWPWARRLVGPPWEFSDKVIASVRDVAARNLFDQLAGQVRDLRAHVQQLENMQREHGGRLAEVVYRPGSRFHEIDAAATDVRRTLAALRERDGGGSNG